MVPRNVLPSVFAFLCPAHCRRKRACRLGGQYRTRWSMCLILALSLFRWEQRASYTLVVRVWAVGTSIVQISRRSRLFPTHLVFLVVGSIGPGIWFAIPTMAS